MSYTITVLIHQTSSDWSTVVEKTIFTKGTWTETNGKQILTMDGSGTSGTLRFLSDKGDYFLIAVGVHNYKPWTDIVTDLESKNSGVEIHPTYYAGQGTARGDRIWAQSRTTEKTNKTGKKLTVNVTGDGNVMTADITIA